MDGPSGGRPDGNAVPPMREPRGPRPGRLEREAIKRGERPFWLGRSSPETASGPTAVPGAGAGPSDYEGGKPNYGTGPARPPFRPRPPAGPPQPREDREDREDRGDRGDRDDREHRAPAQPAAPRAFYNRFARNPSPRPAPAPRPDAAFDDGDDDNLPAEPAPAAPRPAPAAPRPRPAAGRSNAPRHPVKENRQATAPTETQVSTTELIERIIEKSSREVAADLALRQQLKRRRSLPPETAAQIARTVFRYFRWSGWLDPQVPVGLQIVQVNGLAERFRSRPADLTEEELRAKTVPAWTWDALSADVAWLRALQREPQLWLRARTGRRAGIATLLGSSRPGPLPESLAYDGTEDLFHNEAFQSGEFEIQDIASQVVGHLCAPQPGQFWWDACAGEGGKTLHLADLMQGKGLIYASDRAEWRLERLQLRASRAKCFNYRAVPWDGGTKPPTKTLFDGILVDAPCSGLGTWGRNPHSRWTATTNDVSELAAVQKSLLANVAPSVKPSGKLVYAVCTLTRAETTEVAEAFSAAHPDFEPLPFADPFDADAVPAAQTTFWPQQTHGNGMFVAMWRKKAVVPV